MAKKFKKMQIDDFDSLLDSVASNIEPSKEVQKPITEKSIKKEKKRALAFNR